MSKIVTIHQPNFLPWLGYFNKILRSDKFIILDDVQFPKKGGTWMNRVKLRVGGSATWVTTPVVRSYSGVKQCREIEINSATDWQRKMLQLIKLNYAKAEYFDEIYVAFEDIFLCNKKMLVDFNTMLIFYFAEKFGMVRDKFILSSDLNVQGKGTDRLIALVEAVGGDAYMCGGGASGYQEDNKFLENDIELIYQNFSHPEYTQVGNGDFIAGLSILDVVMNCGFSKTVELIKGK